MARPYSRADIQAPSEKPSDSKRPCQACPKNVRSTRPPAPTLDPTPDLPVTSDPPPAPDTGTKTIRVTVIEPSDFLATDLTGHFPTISSRGYKKLCVKSMTQIELLYAPLKTVLFLNISEYTKIFLAIWRGAASVLLCCQ